LISLVFVNISSLKTPHPPNDLIAPKGDLVTDKQKISEPKGRNAPKTRARSPSQVGDVNHLNLWRLKVMRKSRHECYSLYCWKQHLPAGRTIISAHSPERTGCFGGWTTVHQPGLDGLSLPRSRSPCLVASRCRTVLAGLKACHPTRRAIAQDLYAKGGVLRT